MPSRVPPPPPAPPDDPLDEVGWMATAIETLAVVAAFLFAWVQSR